MKSVFPLENLFIIVTCMAFSALNIVFFIFLYLRERGSKTPGIFGGLEIIYNICFSLGILLYAVSQLVIDVSAVFSQALFFHRLQHVGLALSIFAYVRIPSLTFNKEKKAPALILVAQVLVVLSAPFFLTDLLIRPVPQKVWILVQGTETPAYYAVTGVYFLVLAVNAVRMTVFSAVKKMKKDKMLSKEKFLLLSGFIFLATSLIHLLSFSGAVPARVGELLGLPMGMIIYSFLITGLLTREFAATLVDTLSYSRAVSNLREVVEQEYENILTTISDIIEKNDEYTAGHSYRVMNLSCEIGKALGLRGPQLEKIKKSGILHDIGKIGVSNLLLNKPGKLTDEEMEKVRMHSLLGFQIVSQYRPFYEIAVYVKGHHEKLNGMGYPDALTRTDLPLIVKILTVADIYDALKSKRPYRAELSREKSLAIMQDMVDNNEIDLYIFKKLIDVTSGAGQNGWPAGV